MRAVNLIPMAGAGQRFVDAGYEMPKPLIPVEGLPMVVRAARSLPEADHWIFVCQKEHLELSDIAGVLTENFPGCDIVPTDGLTEGQACTCLLARDLLREDDFLSIGACDNGMRYDTGQWTSLWRSSEYDGAIWSFRGNPAVEEKPQAYGWVEIGLEGEVTGVSCKQPISDNPIHDHAVVGAFTFAKAGLFVESVEAMIAQNRRINGEFYMDVALDVAAKMGHRLANFEVKKYICWGTPQDLEEYKSRGGTHPG